MILTSTMNSYTKDTYRYAYAMVKEARSMSMSIDIAEKLQQVKELRFNIELKVLRKRINRRIT